MEQQLRLIAVGMKPHVFDTVEVEKPNNTPVGAITFVVGMAISLAIAWVWLS